MAGEVTHRRWLSVAEAAERAGISAQAVRRRLRAGTWPGRRRKGGRWLVLASCVPAGDDTLD